jgi:putative phosphoesterase
MLDEVIVHYANLADEIWHAGDWGSIEVSDQLIKTGKAVRGVYGNIDDQTIRMVYEKNAFFTCEGVSVFITHIGGYPGRYAPGIKQTLQKLKPALFISGHSHILKVVRDKTLNNMLHMNPGAAGIHGVQTLRTWMIFDIDYGKISNLNVVESQMK